MDVAAFARYLEPPPYDRLGVHERAMGGIARAFTCKETTMATYQRTITARAVWLLVSVAAFCAASSAGAETVFLDTKL